MKIVYANPTCLTCDTEPNKKNCRPCMTRNGRPGYKPKEGVGYTEYESIRYDSRGREVLVQTRRVVS